MPYGFFTVNLLFGSPSGNDVFVGIGPAGALRFTLLDLGCAVHCVDFLYNEKSPEAA